MGGLPPAFLSAIWLLPVSLSPAALQPQWPSLASLGMPTCPCLWAFELTVPLPERLCPYLYTAGPWFTILGSTEMSLFRDSFLHHPIICLLFIMPLYFNFLHSSYSSLTCLFVFSLLPQRKAPWASEHWHLVFSFGYSSIWKSACHRWALKKYLLNEWSNERTDGLEPQVPGKHSWGPPFSGFIYCSCILSHRSPAIHRKAI